MANHLLRVCVSLGPFARTGAGDIETPNPHVCDEHFRMCASFLRGNQSAVDDDDWFVWFPEALGVQRRAAARRADAENQRAVRVLNVPARARRVAVAFALVLCELDQGISVRNPPVLGQSARRAPT